MNKMTNEIFYQPELHHILIVEDEAHVGLFIEVLLSGQGFKVTRCSDGEEALSIFEEASQSFSLVITDQNMPKMCGSVLAKKLLAIRSDIPIILCSGFDFEEVKRVTKDVSIAAYLSKPLKPSALLQQVECFTKEGGHRYSVVNGITERGLN